MTGEPLVILYADSLANRGGTGVYTRRLLSGLAEIGARNTLAAVDGRLVPPAEACCLEPQCGGFRKTLNEHHRLRKIASEASPALVHLPAFSGAPPASVPYVMTLHDLAFMRRPSWFPLLRSIYYRLRFTSLARGAALLLVDSDFTASEAMSLLGTDEGKLRRVYLSTECFVSDPRTFTAKYGIEGEYLLFVGTIEPRKNIPALLDAWELLGDEADDLSLVVAGRWGWGRRSLRSRLEATPGVVWTGPLEGGMLRSAVSGARLMVYPSFYEGFGLPPLEAASAGVPSVLAPAAALTEIYSSVSRIGGSFSGRDLAASILEELATPPDSEGLMAFASEFSDSRMASSVSAVYRELLP